MTRLKAALGGLALCLAAASAGAHVPFLKPNQFNVLNARLQVESAFTELPFQADFAMDSPNFSITAPDGTQQPIRATAKTRAAVYLEPVLAGDGTYRISTGVRPGPTYKAIETAEGKLYFSDDIARKQGRPSSLKYFSRADAYLAKGEPGYVARPMNSGVEIIPLSSPNRLDLGGELRLRVLRDGKPVPNARMVVVADNEHYLAHRAEDLYDVENARDSNLHADGAGEVAFRPTRAGLYFLFVTVHEKIDADHWESHNASLALEVGLPATASAKP
ncbi:DUF4198 domain-containing protein [Lysobacter sp. 5GHs7-4]|uniref:DUF4198 domain-containing protein n=1 Tax=Lysobacter sp. 5GHs7-4 TaxID=2904253 RepID=UPI001E4E2622|nr:DUF4198 domain-containing protein [Lysobacter sp. 5GHs7-4]UHQ23272.1 DUF4198 domain-containing protein [Lysobacter sp. 5GHs7-4]